MIGKFIVLEGCEGSGKTSICERLKREVFTDPNKVIFTREPGGTPLAEEIRSMIFRNAGDPFLELCLFNAARRHHLVNLIMPKLRSGVSVVSDRYVASTYAYQVVARGNPALQILLRRLTHFAELDPLTGCSSFSPRYIFLDVTPEVGLERVKKRKGEATPFDNEEIIFHQKVRQGLSSFMRLGMHQSKISWDVVDANRGKEEVYQDVLRIINELLPF